MHIIGTCLNCLPDTGCLGVNGLVAVAFLGISFVWDCSRKAGARGARRNCRACGASI